MKIKSILKKIIIVTLGLALMGCSYSNSSSSLHGNLKISFATFTSKQKTISFNQDIKKLVLGYKNFSLEKGKIKIKVTCNNTGSVLLEKELTPSDKDSDTYELDNLVANDSYTFSLESEDAQNGSITLYWSNDV